MTSTKLSRLTAALLGAFFLACALFAPQAHAQVATDFYAQAQLSANGDPASGPASGGPQGSVQFYRVNDAANSTRVEMELEGLTPGTSVGASIVLDGCQGAQVAQLDVLNPVGADGKTKGVTTLVGKQVEFGRWYVSVNLCDKLNPDQTCLICGKVSQIMTIGGPGVGTGTPTPAAPGMPATGQAEDAVGVAVALLLGALLMVGTGLWLGKAVSNSNA